MKFRNLVVAAAEPCLLALTSASPRLRDRRRCKKARRDPAANAAIKILRTDIKGNYPCKTNKKGHFFYNGLPPGTYTVSVEIVRPGKGTLCGVWRTRLGDPTPVKLRPAEDRASRRQP